MEHNKALNLIKEYIRESYHYEDFDDPLDAIDEYGPVDEGDIINAKEGYYVYPLVADHMRVGDWVIADEQFVELVRIEDGIVKQIYYSGS